MKKKGIFIGAGVAAIGIASIVVASTVLSGCQKDDVIDPRVPVQEEKEEKATISFDTDGGELVNSLTINKGEKIEEPKIKRENTKEYSFEFDGWFKTNDYSERFDFSKPVNDDLTLYAKWNKIKNKYNVKWLDEDDSLLKEEMVEYGEIPSFTPLKESDDEFSYTFVGWNVTPSKVEADISYKAIYTKVTNEYKVTWKNGDTILNEEEYKYGVTPAFSGDTPQKAETEQYSYEFIGWSPLVDKVTGDVTYRAEFKEIEKEYIIEFKNGDTVLESKKVKYGTMPAYLGETPKKASDNTYNYVFKGWDSEISEVNGDKTYNAVFDKEYIEYNVQFLDYDNSVIESKSYHYGDNIINPTPLRLNTKEFSYEFLGWEELLSANEKNLVFKAKYKETKNKYLIQFKNGDLVLKEEEIEYGKMPSYIGDMPIKNSDVEYSYNFIGWDSEISEVDDNKVYNAKFESILNKYIIQFKNGDLVLDTKNIEYGTMPEYLGDAPKKASDNTYKYVFKGWDSEISNVSGNKTYNAVFDKEYIEYDIQFIDYDNTLISDKKYHYNDEIEVPSNPVRSNTAEFSYEFIGWDSNISNVLGNKVYKALYKETKNKYIISFNSNGGSSVDSETVEYGNKVDMPLDPILEGMNFLGWYTDIELENSYDFSTTVTSSFTLYAKYVTTPIVKYNVEFVFNNGNENRIININEGNKVFEPKNPIKESTIDKDYIFDAWTTDPELKNVYDFNLEVNSNITLYARFKESIRSYNVQFKNGNELLESKLVEYGTIPTYTGLTPKKESTDKYEYTFIGFDKELEEVNGDITYYAKFLESVRKYEITFKDYDGNILYSSELEYGTMPECANPTRLSTPQYEYTFIGWDNDIIAVNGNRTYTAKYFESLRSYEINFLNYDDTVLLSLNLKYGTMPIYNGETPKREKNKQYSYEFIGFDSELENVSNNKNYKAQYKEILNKYTVTFKNYDGTILESYELEYGSTPKYNGATPIKNSDIEYSYKFIGFDNELKAIDKDITYTAVFESIKNKYTVTFKNYDGTILYSESIEYGILPSFNMDLPKRESTAQYEYSFKGWDNDIKAVDGDITYTALFNESIRSYNIKFINDDDTLISETKLEYGVDPIVPTPSKASTAEFDYTFVGYDRPIERVSGDASYKAVYTKNRRSYLVTFKNGDTVLEEKLVEYGKTPDYTGNLPTLESTAQYDYSFKGWDINISEVKGDVTYTAVFDNIIRQYSYTFLNEDGTEAYKNVTADYGSNIIKPLDPKKDSTLYKEYEFIGWFDGSSIVTEFNQLDGNKAYYARFNENDRKYTINWMDGDNLLLREDNKLYDSIYPNGTPLKEGFTFVKWEESINGSTIIRNAIFTENQAEYTVTWLNDDNSLLRVDKVLKDEKASYGTKPVKDGYKFVYWTLDGEVFDLNTKIKSNITLKANYKEIKKVGYGLSYTAWSVISDLCSDTRVKDSKGRYVLNKEVSYLGYTFINNNKNLISADYSSYNNQGADILVSLPKSGDLFLNALWASTTAEGKVTVTNSNNEIVYESNNIKGSGADASFSIYDLKADTYRIHSDASININDIHYEILKEYVNVSYVSNVENVIIDSTKLELGDKLEELPNLNKDNYKLVGWYLDPSFNNLFDINNEINSDIILYAKWEELKVDEKTIVTFASNVSGLSFDSITIEKGKTISLPSKVVSGYRFDDWYTSNTHEEVFNPNTIINSDITIYANYIKQWNVTFKDKDNALISSMMVDNDSLFKEIAKASAPYVDGYVFSYWEYNGNEIDENQKINSDITLIAHYIKDNGSIEKLAITRSEGLLESAYILFNEYNNASDYAIYELDSNNTSRRLSEREYYISKTDKGLRCDLFGLTKGSHRIMVAPVISDSEAIALGMDTIVNVSEYDRSGYAHFNYSDGVGAYNDDGTMKKNAIVLYVTDQNKNSVELTYKGITVKGIGNILNTVGKECGILGHEGQCKMTSDKKDYFGTANTNQDILKKLAMDDVPLIVRFIGTVSETGLYKKGQYNAADSGLIDGLTDYDSVNYGGSVGDNGHMARMKSGKNITLEGVGSDAIIDGWGFHFMSESANPNLGKSFEVRNLTFINTPEDAIGMEGVQSGNTISASVERCWIHNNEFYSPNILNPAESDKSEGDGSCDFKRGMYFTCSYNYFEGCHKTNLVGSSDSSLQYNLTYHHNYWYLCKARGPLTRQANVHMYNNIFYGQTDYCMNTRANAYIFSESNLFYACKNPYRVDGGAIKSYNDSVSSAIYNYTIGTIVDDKNTVVSSDCKYNGVSYSAFELDDNLFYKNDYYLQDDPTDAKKVIYARCGTINATLPEIEAMTMSDISYVNETANNPINNVNVGSTIDLAKRKTIYAFKLTESAKVEINYQSDVLASTGVLCNEAGVALLTGSGTVKLTPGIYFVQPFSIQPGDSKALTQPTFKELQAYTIKFEKFDDSEYQNQLINEFNSLVNNLPTILYNDSSYNKINEGYSKYNQLSASSKEKVSTNYNKLNNAFNEYKSLGINYVEGLINNIVSPITEANASKVYLAKDGYNELLNRIPDAKVSNYNNLINAEKELESIAVSLFINSVNEIPLEITYTDSCKEKIEYAEGLYESLNDAQKMLDIDGANVVLAHEKLINARSTYNDLEIEANKIDVIFIVDGSIYSSLRINKNSKVSLPLSPSKSNYRFDNWYTDSSFNNVFNANNNIDSNITLYARFVEQITVTFLDMDQSVIKAIQSDKNSKIESSMIPNALYESGYKFKYWSLNNNGAEFSFDTIINQNITLYSVYEESSVAEINVTLCEGALESLYAEFNQLDDITDYNAYVKLDGGNFRLIDKQLIRKYPNNYRLDAVGLKSGNYTLKIVPIVNNNEISESAAIISNINVSSHVREGFGFVNGTSNGAYNNDGTLRSDATVIYVTNTNKDTVTFNGATGIQNIVTLLKGNKGYSKPLCIRFIGNITDPSVLLKGDLYVDNATAGLTIEGIGTDATVNGFGIVIKNSSNVEIRNLGFMNCDSSEGDCCGLQQGNNHVWVHNCDFYYGDAGSDADQVKGDGALDTKTSTYITHSFNHFYDTGKSNLQGMKSESTSNYITYHHNWYDHSDSRHPRIRTCTVHIYNNYFDGNAKYGVGMTMGGSAFVENNYFRSEAQMKPMLISGQGTDALGEGTFSGEAGGIIKAYGNTFDGNVSFIPYSENNTSFDAYVVENRNDTIPSTVKAVSGGSTYNNFDTNSSLMYSYNVELANNAKNTVLAYAGRLQGGDLKWQFNNSIDDAKYAVDTELKKAIVNYKSKLVSVLGIENANNPIAPIDNPEEDTKSYEDVIALINALPNPDDVTLANKNAINNANNEYLKLSSSDRANVTNYNKLVSCLAKIAELENSGSNQEVSSNGMVYFNNQKINEEGSIIVGSSISSYKTSGSVEYNNKTYSTAAKINTGPYITIKSASDATLKIYAYGAKSGAKLNVGSEVVALTTDAALYEVSIKANTEYMINKNSGESYIYLIVVE